MDESWRMTECETKEGTVHNSRQLDVFLTVAECGSISAASRELYVSQPAVTQQIAALESEFGAPLFVRSNKGVRLTPAGELLARRVEEARDLLNRTRREIAGLAGAEGLDVTVCVERVQHRFLYEVIDRFSERYPDRRVVVKSIEQELPYQEVVKGACDLCVAVQGNIIRRSGLQFVPLFECGECCAVSRRSSLAGLGIMGPEDFDGFVVAMPPLGYGDSADLVRRCVEGMPGVRLLEAERGGAPFIPAPQAIAADAGLVSFMLRDHVTDVPGVVTVPFRGFEQAVIGLAHRRNPSGSVAAFVEVAREMFGR